MPRLTPAFEAADYCYVTTTGRVTGSPHTVEIWFAIDGTTLYILAGGRERADFVRNAMRKPAITVRIERSEFAGQARVVAGDTAEDALARRLLLEKYAPRSDSDLYDWGRDALVFAVDLAAS